MTDPDLDARLLQAHADQDGHALVELYREAGDLMEAAGDIDAACFYLTQAYVFALELGAPELQSLHTRLVEHGRLHDHKQTIHSPQQSSHEERTCVNTHRQ